MGLWAYVLMGLCAHGLMASGLVGLWACGLVGLWAYGLMGLWASGPIVDSCEGIEKGWGRDRERMRRDRERMGRHPASKLEQKCNKNRSTWGPKSINLMAKINLGRPLGGFLGGLGRSWDGSWGHLGPKMASRAPRTSKSDFWGPLLGAILGSKIDQNRSQERSEM